MKSRIGAAQRRFARLLKTVFRRRGLADKVKISFFKSVVMCVSLDRRPQPDTSVGAFVERLRLRPSLFFKADPDPEPGTSGAEAQAEVDSGAEDEQTQALP